MKEIKGTLTDYRWVSGPNGKVPYRLTTFEVDNKLNRKLKANAEMIRAFDEISGESTFFVHSKEIIGLKNDGRLYKRERIPPLLGKGLLLLGLFMVVWPFLAYNLSADPSLQSTDGFGLKFFSLLVGFVSVPGGLFFLSLGSEYYSRSNRLSKLESMAEKENLKVIEL